MEYFDYYLIHAVDDDRWTNVANPFGVYEKLIKYKEEGRIHNLGFSFHGTNSCLKQMIQEFKWDFVQIQLNYFDWIYQDAKTSYNLLHDAGIPIIVMEPVRGGALARLCPKAIQLLNDNDHQGTPASLALRFVASLDGVQTVLSRMSSKEQLEDNLRTFSDFKPLSDEEMKLVEKIRNAYLESGSIPCTECRYCQPCPKGVLIPEIFSIYNKYVQNQDIEQFRKDFFAIKEEHSPQSCIKCGKCEQICPHSIEITKKLSDIAYFASLHR